ncbi:MAG: CHAT domain-containing protein [Acidobacteriota bacterium]|nr:CHAT domain-containing protein [Acidobacteriota bacterium]
MLRPFFLLFVLSTGPLLAAGTDARAEALRLERHASALAGENRADEALREFAAALVLAQQAGDSQLQASILTKTGSAQLFLGDHGGAATSLEAALALYAKIDASEDEGLAWARLAQAYVAMGAYDAAGDALQKARALGQTTDDPAAKALADAFEAMKIATDDGPSTAFLWSFDAELDLLAGGRLMFDQFWPLLNDLLTIATDPQFVASSSGQRIDSSVPMMTSMLALLEGRDLFAKGKITEARARWMGAVEGVVNNDIRSGLFACIGATYLKEGNSAEAIRWFRSAADATENALPAVRAPELLTSYLGSERRWYHDITIETLLRSGRADEAFDYSERARARAFLQVAGNARVGFHDAPQPLVDEAEKLRARIAQLQRRGRAAQNELRATRRTYENLLLRLRTAAPEYASLTTVQPVTIAEVRKELPRGTTLISYFVSTYGVRAWIIDGETTHSVALPIDRAALDRVLCWADGLRPGGRTRGMETASGDCARRGSAEESYELLFCPLREYVRNERIIIVPHGELHYVPFAALRDRDTGRYLVEDHTITLSPSASAIRFLRAKESPVGGRALVLGNPWTALGPLPGSEREAAAVARAFRTTAKTGSAATEDALHALHGKVDLLHLAAHGVYDCEHPLFAGLTRAMLYAGSAGVISTLWSIDDDASARLMEVFYARLRAGDFAADALRAAQRAMLTSEAYRDPQFWAAFTISGDPQTKWSAPSDRRPPTP